MNLKNRIERMLLTELQVLEGVRQALHDVPAEYRSNNWRMLEMETRFRIIDIKKELYGPNAAAA